MSILLDIKNSDAVLDGSASIFVIIVFYYPPIFTFISNALSSNGFAPAFWEYTLNFFGFVTDKDLNAYLFG